MSDHATGILPDDINRDPRSSSWLIFLDTASGADVQGWMRDTLTPAISALTGTGEAVTTTSVGPTFFGKVNRPDAAPHSFTNNVAATLPPPATNDQHDLVIYVLSRSDAAVAKLIRDTTLGHEQVISAVKIERGYQRADNREVFGQRDGLRNARTNRLDVVFVPDNSNEPAWCHGGSYMAYLKIEQNVQQWPTDPAAQAQIIGRNADGTRQDTPAVTDVTDEGAYANPAVPAPTSHVRKAGPRGANDDAVQIFRRGTPYIEATNGTVHEGLHFVSYQADLEAYQTILNRWMLNQNFPANGTGQDALLAYVTILGGGVYFALPLDTYLGAGIFEPASEPGSIDIRVRVVDANGVPDSAASLAGATLTITTPNDAHTLTTDAAGRAVQTGLPTDVPVTVTQQSAPDGSTTSPGPSPQTITLERCVRPTLTFTNTRAPSAPPGGYGM